MTVDELRVEYIKVCEEAYTAMCMAILSYDDPNYETLSATAWDLMERRETLYTMIFERTE